jgi:RNA polymerase sigma-70 factor (ECF subfamily)
MSVAVLPHASVIRPSAINLPDLDEPAVIARAVDGDKEACGELYHRYRDDVHRILNHLLRDFPTDVDDVASQVFVTVLEQITSYQDRGRPFSAWLHTLIHFKALEHRNWRTSRREYELAVPDSASADLMAQRGLSPENEAILRLELRRLLNSLTARRRLALVLRDWAGWSYDEIARALNLSHRAADALVTQARKAAREAALSERALADRTTCECGCGRPVADSANGSRRFASQDCWQRVEAASRERPAGPMADGATRRQSSEECVLTAIVATGSTGAMRSELLKRTEVPAARLDRILDLLVRQRLISIAQEPGYRRIVTRYRAVASAAAERVA